MRKIVGVILRSFINFNLEARLDKFWRDSSKGKKVGSKRFTSDTELIKEVQTKHPEVQRILEEKNPSLDLNLKKLTLKESAEHVATSDLRHSGIVTSSILKNAADASTTNAVKVPPGKISFPDAIELMTLSQKSLSDAVSKAKELGLDVTKAKTMFKYVAPFEAVRDIVAPPAPGITESKRPGREERSFHEYLQAHTELADRIASTYNKKK